MPSQAVSDFDSHPEMSGVLSPLYYFDCPILAIYCVSRGSGVFFGQKRQRLSPSNSPKKTPDPFLLRTWASRTNEISDLTASERPMP